MINSETQTSDGIITNANIYGNINANGISTINNNNDVYLDFRYVPCVVVKSGYQCREINSLAYKTIHAAMMIFSTQALRSCLLVLIIALYFQGGFFFILWEFVKVMLNYLIFRLSVNLIQHLQNMLKDMYDDGDDKMKELIGSAMMKSRDPNRKDDLSMGKDKNSPKVEELND